MPKALAVRKVLTRTQEDLSILHRTERRPVTRANDLRNLAELTQVNLKLSFRVVFPIGFLAQHKNSTFSS